MKERNRVIDCLKGILIILVVLGHSLNNVIESPYLNKIPGWIPVLKGVIYSFHMPAFFLLSGIFSYNSAKKGIYPAIKEKIFRLLVPYFIWSFLSTVAKIIFKDFQNNKRGFDSFLKSFYIPVGIYWFLYILFMISILYIIFSAIFKTEIKTAAAFLITGAALFIFGHILKVLPQVYVLPTLYYYFLFFSLGLFVNPIRKRFLKEEIIKKPIKPLYKLGEKTMDIYCMHQFVAGFIRIIFLKLFLTSFVSLRVIAVAALTTVICYLISVSRLSNLKIYKIMMGCKIK